MSPTITDRDFVIATVVAPTVLVEPEKTEEAALLMEKLQLKGAEAVAEAAKTEEGKDKAAKPSDDKTKALQKPTDKGKAASKETKKK